MSTKVCVKAWNGGPHKTNDAVTIGNLAKMVGTLLAFGYDEDSPVTLLFDEHHVWLETVEFHEEDGYEPHVEGFRNLKIPRIVDNLLDPSTRDAEWIDRFGHRMRWVSEGWQKLFRDSWSAGYEGSPGCGPYTEVVDD